MTTLAERIKAARRHAGLTQRELAGKVGIEQPMISQLETGKSRQTASIAKIAHICGVSAIWLADGNGQMVATESADNVAVLYLQSDELLIPHYDLRHAKDHGQLPASYSDTLRTVVIREAALTEQGVTFSSPEALAMISGWGDSMRPTVDDKDPMIVDRGVNAFIGEGLYLVTWDGKLYIRRLQNAGGGQLKLIPDNPHFMTIEAQADAVRVHARVVMVWRGARG